MPIEALHLEALRLGKKPSRDETEILSMISGKFEALKDKFYEQTRMANQLSLIGGYIPIMLDMLFHTLQEILTFLQGKGLDQSTDCDLFANLIANDRFYPAGKKPKEILIECGFFIGATLITTEAPFLVKYEAGDLGPKEVPFHTVLSVLPIIAGRPRLKFGEMGYREPIVIDVLSMSAPKPITIKDYLDQYCSVPSGGWRVEAHVSPQIEHFPYTLIFKDGYVPPFERKDSYIINSKEMGVIDGIRSDFFSRHQNLKKKTWRQHPGAPSVQFVLFKPENEVVAQVLKEELSARGLAAYCTTSEVSDKIGVSVKL
jgi:hypothetical protein